MLVAECLEFQEASVVPSSSSTNQQLDCGASVVNARGSKNRYNFVKYTGFPFTETKFSNRNPRFILGFTHGAVENTNFAKLMLEGVTLEFFVLESSRHLDVNRRLELSISIAS